MSAFLLQPLKQRPDDGDEVGGRGGDLRNEIDKLWDDEQSRPPEYVGVGAEPEVYPEEISDNRAVRTAYKQEMDAVADFLRNGLSVLVVCDKILTEFIYEFVCNQAGKTAVLDTSQPEGMRMGQGGQLDQALQGGNTNPLANLPMLINSLRHDQVLVIRSLDLLDTPLMTELLYQRTGKGHKPQLLSFLDPSLEVKKVLSDRFAVHVGIMGLPRYVALNSKATPVHTVSHLLTRAERTRFSRYDPEGLYKNVSGLNAIQFRNAMQYVGARVEEGANPSIIYRHIRKFKTSSNEEIEIPDTTFESIGGYEHIKQQLRRIIALVAGPVEGINEKQRGELIPRGFIFHGPPGTGKTLFAKAIANEMNATIQMISGPEIMDKYVGQSETNLRRIFATARRNAPSVIFFDEFDSIASQRSTYSDGGARANNAVVAQLLTEMDGFRQEQAVLIIGTTNRIDIIDEALLRPSRLRPIEIGLPDQAGRQRVSEIHSRNFGFDRLLTDICALASEYVEAWEGGGATDAERSIPPSFLAALFARHPPYERRYQAEHRRAAFVRDLSVFFRFVCNCRSKGGSDGAAEVLDRVSEQVVLLGERYGADLRADSLQDLSEGEAEARLMPMQVDLRDLFTGLQQERRRRAGLTPAAFWMTLLDLIAEYTVDFNNDEIRAIFQEASLEHHMEGQLITPRYIGKKIGLIRKRRDERKAVHLSAQRGHR
ncbi:MAG: ATP-binding protein, partial [Pyrinomonadaceae bacterium]